MSRPGTFYRRHVEAAEDVQRGPWLQTYTGRRFYVLDPRPEDIDILDIAHALSRQTRYNGHIGPEHYSVAEHSVLVSNFMPERDSLPLWALLHDAAEAYIGDMPYPIKPLFPRFKEIEAAILRAVAERFGLPGHIIPDLVDAYDKSMFTPERKWLLVKTEYEWNVPPQLPICPVISCWRPDVAEAQFLHRFNMLTAA